MSMSSQPSPVTASSAPKPGFRETPSLEAQKPLVTIGLPVYNGERFIREAIDSLLTQTLTNFILIISDNASTDNTPDIVKGYQEHDPRIRYIRQTKNVGQIANLRFLAGLAETKFFMWASDDDIWAKNYLEVVTQNITSEDVGVRGKLLLTREGCDRIEKNLPNFRQGNFLRCFLGNENNYRSHYAYCLFHLEKLRSSNLDSLELDYYPDALFIYCLLHQGALRSIGGTHIEYRIHDNNLGKEYSRPWKGWKKILFRIHPLRYYLSYLHYSNNPVTKLTILLMIPIKHIYAQVSFWLRGFRELITGKQVI